MAIDWTLTRRRLFSGTAAALLAGMGAGVRSAHALTMPGATLITAARIDGTDSAAVISPDGISGFSLPGRAHALTKLTSGEVALIGRRPGRFVAIVDPGDPDRPARLFAPLPGYRLAGHAALTPDGRTLATTEIDVETGDGIVVMRDPSTGTPRGHWPVGIEPHDLLFTPDGARLVVAAGGIAYSAEVKGPPINAGRIESAIVELDARSGAVLKRHVLPESLRSLSLRHMAMAPAGYTIAFGMQDQDRSTLRPVMGVLQIGKGLDLLPLPSGDDEGALRFYIGSVAIDAGGRIIAATSPKGGAVGLWTLSDGRWLGGLKIGDVCGLAAGEDPGTFWVTSGFGDVLQLRAIEEGFVTDARWHAPIAFDNHLIRI